MRDKGRGPSNSGTATGIFTSSAPVISSLSSLAETRPETRSRTRQRISTRVTFMDLHDRTPQGGMQLDREVLLVGIDGCPGGWLAAAGLFLPEKGAFSGEKLIRESKLKKIFSLPAALFAVDMPLGLPERFLPGGRPCDRLARKLLGKRRGAIFTPPPREAFAYEDYEALRRRGIRLNRQSFLILPKVRELDACLKGPLKEKVFETHPELVFRVLCGELPSKHKEEGLRRRLSCLLEAGLFRDLAAHFKNSPSRLKKDLLDAYACLLAAKRIFRGEAEVIPERPARDACGLPMAIWF